MKFICLGYIEEKRWEAISDSQRNAMIDECFTYDDVLRKMAILSPGKLSKAPEMQPHCDGKKARFRSPMAPTPRPKNSWGEY
jgi:hypothetical protein